MADHAVSCVLKLYSTLNYCPPDGQFTILAAFILSHGDKHEVISLATGTKCLPDIKLPRTGDVLHDSHAEVLARRGAVRWFLEEAIRLYEGTESKWIVRSDGGVFQLKDEVVVRFYVSTLPCGDASTRYLALTQDEVMATLKNSSERTITDSYAAARGRDNYSLYGVLRTKPGRADSPPSTAMSCSDKIARWNVLGFQGALASRLFNSLYISEIIIGDIPSELQTGIRADCDRAFWGRLKDIQDIAAPFRISRPAVFFTPISFVHASKPGSKGSCIESLCWSAYTVRGCEVLINGLKRGVAPKHRHREKSRPMLSKLALFVLYEQALLSGNIDADSEEATYFDVKMAHVNYQATKERLQGEMGPFRGWLRTGREWESFSRVEQVKAAHRGIQGSDSCIKFRTPV
ncbi:adenosine deaminase/editase [Pleurotus eryngii]|uniref:Adenosine deaminase/editase n=1 Tax=Pleurotus eryngii TaxID=5323 RepID=A0A9P6DB91_PLEER|nr:adenosine deaminase/editase [Pleurotus eryngii]